MMAHLAGRQRFSNGGDAIIPQPNPLSPQERNQKVFHDYVGRMKHYLTGADMPEWFVKDLIIKKAEELGVELKASGGKIGGGVIEGTNLGDRTGFEDPNFKRLTTAIEELNTKFTTEKVTEAAEILYPNQEVETILKDAQKRRKIKKHLADYGEASPTDARSKGWEKRITTPDNVIRERLLKKGTRVQQHNGKFIFADVAEQAAFDEVLRTRYSSAKTSTGGKQAGVLINDQIYEKFLKDNYARTSIDDLIDRHKKANNFEYVKLSADQKKAHKVERDKLIKQYQDGMRASGTKTHPAHHLYSLSDEFDVKSKDIVIIPEDVNARMQDMNKKIKLLAEKRKALLEKIDVNNVKHIPDELKAIDKEVQNLIDGHYKKFPDDDGLLKWRKINSSIGADGLISFSEGSSIGGDSKKWIHKDMGKNINKLDANERRVFKAYLLNKAKEMDLKKIKGVGTFLHSFPANLAQSKVVKKIASGLLKVLRPVAKGAVVLDPMFLASDVSEAFGKGASGGEAAEYGVKKIGQDILNLPGLVAGGIDYGIQKLRGKGEKAGPFEYLPTKPKYDPNVLAWDEFTFAQDKLKKQLDETPENVKLRRISDIEFDNTMLPNMTMVDVMDTASSREEIDIARDKFLTEKLGENYETTHPKEVKEIEKPEKFGKYANEIKNLKIS